LANIAWLFLWHYEVFEFTLIAMGGLLLSLIAIYLRLDIDRGEVSNAEKWSVQVPFSIYLGWITVATIANATQLVYYLGWNGWSISPELWAVIMLAAGVIISAIMSLTRADIAYSLVLVWAYSGIAIQHNDTTCDKLRIDCCWVDRGDINHCIDPQILYAVGEVIFLGIKYMQSKSIICLLVNLPGGIRVGADTGNFIHSRSPI
jgi:hypothetical protein